MKQFSVQLEGSKSKSLGRLNISVFTGSRAYLSLVWHRHGAEVIKDSRAEGLQLIASEHGKFSGFLADSH